MSITSSNIVFTLTVPGVFPAPVTMSQFAEDVIFQLEKLTIAETRMSVDGYLAAGIVNNPVPLTIRFLPQSPSINFFETVKTFQKINGQVYEFFGSIAIPAIGKSYTLTRGFLTSVTVAPTANKTLADVEYDMVWESIDPSPI